MLICPACQLAAKSEVERTFPGMIVGQLARARRCGSCGHRGVSYETWFNPATGTVPAPHPHGTGTVPATRMLPAPYRQPPGTVPVANGGVGGDPSSDPGLSDLAQSDLKASVSGARARVKATRGPRRAEEYSVEFNAFWSAYPKKKRRAEAWKSWQTIKPPVDLVMAALGWQVEQHDWLKEAGKYVPKAADWIEDAGWTAKPSAGSRALSKIEQKTEEHREMFLGGREWANR